MSRPLELVRAYDARGAARKAARERTYARRKRAAKTRCDRAARAPAKRRKGVARHLAAVRALPGDVRAAYDAASPAVRRLILEQAKDDAVLVIARGPSLDDVLPWMEARA